MSDQPTSRSANNTSSAAMSVLGVGLLLAGIGFNTATLGLIAEDGEITGMSTSLMVGGCQLFSIVLGAWLLVKAQPSLSRLATLAVACFALLVGGYLNFSGPAQVWQTVRTQEQLLTAIGRSEDQIQWLTTKFPRLNSSTMNLAVPGIRSAELFADEVLVTGLSALADSDHLSSVTGGIAVVQHLHAASAAHLIPKSDLNLWLPLFELVEFFEHAKFKIVRGRFVADDRYEVDVAFEAVAHLDAGGITQIHGSLRQIWGDHSESEEEKLWLLHEWHSEELELISADSTLFVEDLDRAVPDLDARARARQSLHEQLVLRTILDEEDEGPEWFTRESQDRHPGVSVVDIDGDGLDDIYVMARLGRNLMFRNRGDGTFEDIAPELGLDIENHTACALFADFDNDGDVDAILGRTLEPSLYLVNEGGRFLDRSADLVEGPLPALVSAISAADYDSDGLLDVYFSTYSARLHMPLVERMRGQAIDALTLPFLSDADASGFYDRCMSSGMHNFRNCPGPPNLLLRNTGGRFEVAPSNADVQVWRHTFQSVFADYDGDGDPDVYVANDFAPNNLLRNDEGRFVDVTEETETADIGFGMGATWGDYDNDGAQDLYVTNMFSKAGRRITAQIAELDPRLTQLARGNSLFRNQGQRFEKVSGMEAPELLVEKVGWSWGAQFLDFNNDGFLDLYAPSGFYTAPSQVEIPIDL